ncbi:hypothetical protein FXN65_13710 [Metapseudomonas lalkuanensis]|uniref:Uncharacterized protein n=1 Tax=Metapseudomonas lalkuanensis TaxID=2604832 RepID=A0A5J6QJY6_9GAMM|nr:hypothetical protein [Pseudomonas lalkuanensis]QEY63068.1 hypothetical protein FXN65_13710 [Pseudomonas lalkuanensis]
MHLEADCISGNPVLAEGRGAPRLRMACQTVLLAAVLGQPGLWQGSLTGTCCGQADRAQSSPGVRDISRNYVEGDIWSGGSREVRNLVRRPSERREDRNEIWRGDLPHAPEPGRSLPVPHNRLMAFIASLTRL